MSKSLILGLALSVTIGLGWNEAAFAQQPNQDFEAEAEQSPARLIDDLQDSMLADAFPLLRTLIDLLSQLIDLLNQAGEIVGGGNTDPGDVDPGDIDPGNNGIPGIGGASTAEPGGWGQGPVPSVP